MSLYVSVCVCVCLSGSVSRVWRGTLMGVGCFSTMVWERQKMCLHHGNTCWLNSITETRLSFNISRDSRLNAITHWSPVATVCVKDVKKGSLLDYFLFVHSSVFLTFYNLCREVFLNPSLLATRGKLSEGGKLWSLLRDTRCLWPLTLEISTFRVSVTHSY